MSRIELIVEDGNGRTKLEVKTEKKKTTKRMKQRKES